MSRPGSFSDSGDAAHGAIDLAVGYLTGGPAPVLRWDGWPREALDLIAAQAKLSAILAASLCGEPDGPADAAVVAARFLEMQRVTQPPRGVVEEWPR